MNPIRKDNSGLVVAQRERNHLRNRAQTEVGTIDAVPADDYLYLIAMANDFDSGSRIDRFHLHAEFNSSFVVSHRNTFNLYLRRVVSPTAASGMKKQRNPTANSCLKAS